MTNILQHHRGLERDGKVELVAYLVRDVTKHVSDISYKTTEDIENIEIEGHTLPVLYSFRRKPVDSFGHFTVFRINGREEVPDLSLPMRLTKLPRDAKKLTEEEMRKYWLR